MLPYICLNRFWIISKPICLVTKVQNHCVNCMLFPGFEDASEKLGHGFLIVLVFLSRE